MQRWRSGCVALSDTACPARYHAQHARHSKSIHLCAILVPGTDVPLSYQCFCLCPLKGNLRGRVVVDLQDREANELQASVVECEGAATLLARERDELVQELQLASDGESASTKIASNLHKECAARAQQLESIRSQMTQQTEQVESLTKALNEASTAKEMALHHAAEVDAELQSLKRHAALISEQLASTMAGRAVGTLSGIDAVVAGERQARAAAVAAASAMASSGAATERPYSRASESAPAAPVPPPAFAAAEAGVAAAEPSVTRRAMPRPWDANATTAMPMPVDTDLRNPAVVAAHGRVAARKQSAPAAQRQTTMPPGSTEEGGGDGGWLPDNEQSLGRYIRSLDGASNAKQQRVAASQQPPPPQAAQTAACSSSSGDVNARVHPEALFARWGQDGGGGSGGSASAGEDRVQSTAAGMPSQQQQQQRGARRGGGAGMSAADAIGSGSGSIRPTNAWR